MLKLPWWPAVQKRTVQSFVLQGLDFIPRTAGIAYEVAGESKLVELFEKNNPQRYEPAFYASVIRKWRSNEVTNVLRVRSMLQTGVASSGRESPSSKHGSAPTSRSTGCEAAPFPPVTRRRTRSKSSRAAPAVVLSFTAALNTRRWTGGRTKTRVERGRRHVKLRRRQRKELRVAQTRWRKRHKAVYQTIHFSQLLLIRHHDMRHKLVSMCQCCSCPGSETKQSAFKHRQPSLLPKNTPMNSSCGENSTSEADERIQPRGAR